MKFDRFKYSTITSGEFRDFFVEFFRSDAEASAVIDREVQNSCQLVKFSDVNNNATPGGLERMVQHPRNATVHPNLRPNLCQR